MTVKSKAEAPGLREFTLHLGRARHHWCLKIDPAAGASASYWRGHLHVRLRSLAGAQLAGMALRRDFSPEAWRLLADVFSPEDQAYDADLSDWPAWLRELAATPGLTFRSLDIDLES